MNWHYLYVFAQSNLVEVLFLIFFYGFKRYAFSGEAFKGLIHIALVVTVANSITHPIVVFLIVRGPWSYLTGILAAETFAFAAEVFLHQPVNHQPLARRMAGSLLANLLSWQAGPVLTALVFFSKSDLA